MNISRYLNNQNWNIGFADLTPKELISSRKLPKIRWMKHNYKDRFFADPFILEVNEEIIEVLAEEYEFKKNSKGVIVKLRVDRKNFSLIDRQVLLASETHLSYPIIMEKNNSIFIYPENSESGFFSEYIYDREKDKLKFNKIVSTQPLTDATPLAVGDDLYLFATSQPKSLENLYLFKYKHEIGQYVPFGNNPIVEGKGKSRMGGNFFTCEGKLYRPAQDCSCGYGKALTIFEVKSIWPEYIEESVIKLTPISWKYNIGLHTINFDKTYRIGVIDSYGYLYPLTGRILMNLHRIKEVIKSLIDRQ